MGIWTTSVNQAGSGEPPEDGEMNPISIHCYPAQQTRDVEPKLFYCWTSELVNASLLLAGQRRKW